MKLTLRYRSVLLRAFLVLGSSVLSILTPLIGATASTQSQTPFDLSPLEQALKEIRRQPVISLERNGLSLILNERFEDIKIEGWSTKALTPPETDLLLSQFGVRAVWNQAQGTSYFLRPKNVGRAGILEGDIYFKLNGKIFRGLTLKGYGGNQGSGFGAQPEGSLSLSESIRDLEVSTILADNKVDTYLGVLIVERPDGKANYVRLSRTALRMEDLIRVKGNSLKSLVDYLTDLLKEEVGKKLTPVEFSKWLIQSTGDLMARKDYLRFRHASVTLSNLGIGEMVDLGDESMGNSKGGLMLPNEYSSKGQSGFKDILKLAHENLGTLDPEVNQLSLNELYDSTYKSCLEQLQSVDRARINLNHTTRAELTSIGFSSEEAHAVIKYNLSTPDGILDPAEIASLKSMTRDLRAVLEHATTDFLKLSDGSTLSEYYVRNLGGADGVRELLSETRTIMKEKGFQLGRDTQGNFLGPVKEVEREIQKLAVDQAKKRGFLRAVTANRVTNFSRFISRQALEVLVRR